MLTLSAVPSEAYFKDIGAGVRPVGMGGAYVAVADDANAALWNASGLAQLEKQEMVAMYSSLYAGLNAKLYTQDIDVLGYHFISYAHPTYRNIGAFAFGWATFQSTLYDENIFSLSYARNISRHFYTGLSFKRLSWSIEGNKYTRLDKDIPDSGISKSGFTLDLSALYKPTQKLSFGLSLENLLPADVGLNAKQVAPVNLRMGAAYKSGRLEKMKDTEAIAAFDVTVRLADTKQVNLKAGVEAWFFDKSVAVRTGFQRAGGAIGFGYRATRGDFELQLDYAFLYPILSIQHTYGSHRISMSMRF